MKSLLALLEGDTDGAVRHVEATEVARNPEILIYFARHYSRIGLADAAIGCLRRAAETGFVCAPETLNSDVWLETIRTNPNFELLVEDATRRVKAARNISTVQ